MYRLAVYDHAPAVYGRTIFRDGSRLENGGMGYAVTWKKRSTWKGHKTHMGWGQEAYDVECAAIARHCE